jgi:hypothetical protein
VSAFKHPTIAKHFRVLNALLLLNQISVDLAEDIQSHGAFVVECHSDNNGIKLKPRVRLRKTPTSESPGSVLVFLHEVGHCVLHCNWLAELRLLHFVADHVRHKLDMARGAVLHACLDTYHKRLVTFFSAVERGADRFACSVLLPTNYLELVLRHCYEGQRVDQSALLALTGLRLGIPDKLDSRFLPLILERLEGLALDPGLVSPRDQGQLAESISRHRVEMLLTRLWAEFGEVLGASVVPNSMRRARENAEVEPSGFFFGGIVCH